MSAKRRREIEPRIATACILVAMGFVHSACSSMPIMASTRTIPAGTWETRPSASLLANPQERTPDRVDFIPAFSLHRGLSPTTEIGIRVRYGSATVELGRRFDIGALELTLRPELGVQLVLVCHDDDCGAPYPSLIAELPILLGAKLGSNRVVAGPHFRVLYSNLDGGLLSNTYRDRLDLGPAVIPGAVIALEYGMKSGAHLLFGLQGHRLQRRRLLDGMIETAYLLQASITISFEP